MDLMAMEHRWKWCNGRVGWRNPGIFLVSRNYAGTKQGVVEAIVQFERSSILKLGRGEPFSPIARSTASF